MNPLDVITFDATGFVRTTDEPTRRTWTTPRGDLLVLSHRLAPPDIPGSIADLPRLRAYYRKVIEASGGVALEFERRVLDRLVTLRLALHAPIDAQHAEAGRRFVASITFPFRTMSYVFTTQCEGPGVLEAPDVPPPDHPLARARATLDHIEATLRVDASARALPRFTGLP